MSFGILPIEDIKSCGVSADRHTDQNVADVPSGDITETKFYDTNGEVYATITRPSGDLISRADAIDSINKTNSTLDEIPICKDIRSAFANAIKALPSADVVSREDYNKLLDDSIWQSEHIGKMFEYIDDCVTEMCDRQKVNSAEWVEQKEREFEELHRPKEDSKPEPYVPEASTERVVHCKDCIYSRQPEEELFVCENRFGLSGWVRKDEFCSSGSL